MNRLTVHRIGALVLLVVCVMLGAAIMAVATRNQFPPDVQTAKVEMPVLGAGPAASLTPTPTPTEADEEQAGVQEYTDPVWGRVRAPAEAPAADDFKKRAFRGAANSAPKGPLKAPPVIDIRRPNPTPEKIDPKLVALLQEQEQVSQRQMLSALKQQIQALHQKPAAAILKTGQPPIPVANLKASSAVEKKYHDTQLQLIDKYLRGTGPVAGAPDFQMQ